MNNHVETAAVMKVIQAYKDGTYCGEADTLKGVFHDRAVMNGFLGPDILIGDPAPFIEDIGATPSMRDNGDPYRAEVESIRIEGNVASVILSETGFRGAGVLVDFFHLIKEDGAWKIVSKLFTTL
ncbi:MAG: nuclear transport factor 2 family protein [Clostridiales Family XIII bacterium]|jgi:hypothetical protein|nr:nuclear transport factor 2 family protein [Clostridiales Family XIII bacterium]